MIRLLEVPSRDLDLVEDEVCLCDPNGSYLREQEMPRGLRQIVVKGPMQGTLDDYARAASQKMDRQMVVKGFAELDPIKVGDIQCYSIILRPA